MGSLDAPEIKEPESNQQLARHSTQLINLSRDQFGSIQKMNRQNLRNAGNRTGELQGRVAAGYTQAGGAAVERYGPGLRGSNDGGARIAGAMSGVAVDQNRRGIAGQMGLLNDARGQTTSAMSGLGALSNMEYSRNVADTRRRAGTM